MTHRNSTPLAAVGGFNVEKAIVEHVPEELKAAEREVRLLERKLDSARERVYRLRNILAAVAPVASNPEAEQPPSAVARDGLSGPISPLGKGEGLGER